LSRKIGTKIIATVKRKLTRLDLEEIVNFMYKLVKLNYKDFEFMKDVERVIIEQKIPINYPLIRKMLWSYTHLDVGSTVLYAHIAKTLKIGQH
jgi:predicted nucleotidyltransferase